MLERANLKDYSIDALRARLARDGLAPYRAEQIAGWLYRAGSRIRRRCRTWASELRARLGGEWDARALEVVKVERSEDGTLKAALRARDGARVEAVLIPEDERTTLCVSTQVGCPLACSFCATGALGFTRNLAAARDRRPGLPHARAARARAAASPTSSSWAWASRC